MGGDDCSLGSQLPDHVFAFSNFNFKLFATGSRIQPIRSVRVKLCCIGCLALFNTKLKVARLSHKYELSVKRCAQYVEQRRRPQVVIYHYFLPVREALVEGWLTAYELSYLLAPLSSSSDQQQQDDYDLQVSTPLETLLQATRMIGRGPLFWRGLVFSKFEDLLASRSPCKQDPVFGFS